MEDQQQQQRGRSPPPWDEKELIIYLASLHSSTLSNPHNPPRDPPSSLLHHHQQHRKIPIRVIDKLNSKGFVVDSSGTVSWSPHTHHPNPTHPRHWALVRKTYDTAVIIFLEFFMTLVSNTGSSIAPFAAPELGVSRETALFAFTTLYLLGQALGGLVFPPIAESFGGRTIYLTSTFGFALGCVVLAAWPRVWWVVVLCRFATGLLSAMPCVVAKGSVENMWDMTARTFVIHAWIAAAVVGLALGPPVATWVATSGLGWYVSVPRDAVRLSVVWS